jgi:uncharacterized protein YecE (DUF72 family)
MMNEPLNTYYYSGTSGLVLEIPKRSFPPEHKDKSRLQYYASLLNSLEVNSSFYKPPMATTVQKWAYSVPGDFRFTYKLWKGITHNKGLTFNPDDVDGFLNIINQAGDKKGCLLVQFPGSATIASLAQFDRMMTAIREADPLESWKVAVEFRHPSWHEREVFELLDHYNMALVIHDHPKCPTPVVDSPVDFIYLRFHGPTGDYTGTYTDAFLQNHARQIYQWMTQHKQVYVYFNNTVGEAVRNLFTLNKFVEEMS